MSSAQKLFLALSLGGVGWLLFVFYSFPRQAWIDGLIEAYFMSSGLVIYKDFVTQYFPILYLSMLPFHSLFGFTLKPTIALAPVASILAFLLLAFISFKLLKGWFRIIPLLFFLFWDPILSENHFATTSYQNILLLIAFTFWWFWYQRPTKAASFFIGLLLGLSAMSGQITFIPSAIIFFSIVVKSLQVKRAKDAIFFSLAFLIPVFFVLIWLLAHNALLDFYSWAIYYYFSGHGYPFAMGREIGNTIIFLTVFFPLVCVGTVIFFKIKKTKEIKMPLQQLVFWGLILLSFPLPFWFAIFHPNRFLTAEGIYALSFGLALQVLFRKNSRVAKVLVVIFLMLFMVSFYLVLPKYQRNFSYPRQYLNLTRIYPEDPLFEVVEWIKKNTTKDDKLFATVDSLVYLETQRLPANPRASTNLPVFYRPIEKAVAEMNTNPPQFWVIDERQWARFDDFGYKKEALVLKKIINCEPVVFRSSFITIRKHKPGEKLCLN